MNIHYVETVEMVKRNVQLWRNYVNEHVYFDYLVPLIRMKLDMPLPLDPFKIRRHLLNTNEQFEYSMLCEVIYIIILQKYFVCFAKWGMTRLMTDCT